MNIKCILCKARKGPWLENKTYSVLLLGLNYFKNLLQAINAGFNLYGSRKNNY